MSFWASDFWATDFWATLFWNDDGVVPAVGSLPRNALFLRATMGRDAIGASGGIHLNAASRSLMSNQALGVSGV